MQLNELSPTMVEVNGYKDTLYTMLQDVDSNVVTNVIFVLNELQINQGGMEASQSTVMHLLNRIGEFSEWGLNAILELVSRYKPSSEDELFALMNLLDPVLRTANSGAVLATFKCFMRLANEFPDLQPQIYARAKPPLLTLITGSSFEVQYATLKHMEVILPRRSSKGIFDDEYRQFFVRYNEPSNVKHLKVELLPLISNDANAKDIAMELGEYVTDVDSELAKRAINALGEIAMRVASISQEITQTLMELVDLDIPYVRAEAVKNLSNVVRIFPAVRIHVLPLLAKCLRRVDDPEARAVLLWMLGEYGQEIQEAPYLLEPIIDNYAEESSAEIKLQVLTASLKMFFKRPPEMQAMLGRLFASAVNDTSSQDVHDRALLYYRLLSSDISVAESLFASLRHAGTESGLFAEDCDTDKRDQIFSEINTLAVIYGMPSIRFIADKYQQVGATVQSQMCHCHFPFVQKIDAPPMADLQTFLTIESTSPSQQHKETDVALPTGQISTVERDQSFTNLLDLGFTDVAIVPPVCHLLLASGAEMSPQQFQQTWASLPDAFAGLICTLSRLPTSTSDVEALARSVGVMTMASGPLSASSQGMKFFVYGFGESDLVTGTPGKSYLAQMTIEGSGAVNIVVKSSDSSSLAGEMFGDHLGKMLKFASF